MSNIRAGARGSNDDVIVIDSDDENDLVSTSGRQTTGALPKAGHKRNRPVATQAVRQRSVSRQIPVEDDVVDLTTYSSQAQRASIQNSNQAAPSTNQNSAYQFSSILEVSPTGSSPSAKQRKVAVAKALQAHRKLGQQNAAFHDIQQMAAPTETDNKPKCGICLDDMKEPACGNCGHVFCRSCLLACIKSTKKCPTCRKNLQPRTVHRIYLS